MTQAKAQRHARTTGPDKRTCWGAFTLEFDKLLEATGNDDKWHWPNPAYRQDPVAFMRECLAMEPWVRQIELLEAVRDHRRVAVRAGRKVSKSCSAAIIALWWFCSWYDAQVVMTSTTARQVDEILWDEVKKMHFRSSMPVDPEDPALQLNPNLTTRAIDGEPKILARSGLASGFRKIAGFTAREGVAAQGKSGAHLLYIADEASGIPQAIIDAIVGNMAGGGRLVLFGNPTKAEDEFFEAFNSKQLSDTNPTGYKTLTISSEESPNVVAQRTIVPGLAEWEWIEERRREWGPESVMYKVHILGQHVTVEEGKIISLHDIKCAEERWNATGETRVEGIGVLHIGIDPALSKDGDESAFAARRGSRLLELLAFRDLTEDDHLVHLLGLIKTHGRPGELVVVNLDALGDVGTRVMYVLRNYAEQHPGVFVLCAIRGSDNAVRDPAAYLRVRDELWGSFAMWLREGGAIPEDPKLARDLHAPSWTFDLKQRKIATDKKTLRKALGRSPDRGDAACLSCWENTRAAEAHQEAKAAPSQRQSNLDEPAAQGMDPYAGMAQWQGR